MALMTKQSMFFSLIVALSNGDFYSTVSLPLGTNPTDQIAQGFPTDALCHFCHGPSVLLFSSCPWYSPVHLPSHWMGLMNSDFHLVPAATLIQVPTASLLAVGTNFQPPLWLQSLIFSIYFKSTTRSIFLRYYLYHISPFWFVFFLTTQIHTINITNFLIYFFLSIWKYMKRKKIRSFVFLPLGLPKGITQFCTS